MASVILHAIAAVLLFTLRFSSEVPPPPKRPVHVVLLAPLERPPAPRPHRKLETPKPLPAPKAPVTAARIFHPVAAPAVTAPAQRRVAIELPAPEVAAATPTLPVAPDPVTPLPKVTLQPLKTDNLASAETAAPAAAKPALKSAGFGVAESPAQGNTRRTIASAGFDATGIAGHGPAQTAEIARANFGDATAATATRRDTAAARPADFTPAEILYKPRPVYTEEARRLRIEGEVLLEVLFGAAGDLHIQRIVRGLAHGLDESALAAAREIRFRPAKNHGEPVDSAALVHIVFQLAY